MRAVVDSLGTTEEGTDRDLVDKEGKMRTGIRRPSPALVVAMIALFASLGGYATAATIVPLAKRALTADTAKKATLADTAKKALVADNAKKLGGLTIAQLAAGAEAAATAAAQAAASQPGPASTAAGLVTVKTQSGGQIGSGQFRELGSMTCDSGSKIMGGGLSSDGIVATFDSYPANDTTWAFSAANLGSGTANISLWITCLQ